MALALLCCSVTAHAVVTVNAPWVRPTSDRKGTEAYMVVTSSDDAILREARSATATTVVMRAAGTAGRKLENVPLPACAAVKFAPGLIRFELVGLARALKVAERVPIVRVLELPDGAHMEIPVNAEVRLRSPIDDERRAHAHAH